MNGLACSALCWLRTVHRSVQSELIVQYIGDEHNIVHHMTWFTCTQCITTLIATNNDVILIRHTFIRATFIYQDGAVVMLRKFPQHAMITKA